MGNSMTENTPSQEIASLVATRAGVVSAMTMHVERSEELYAEVQKIDAEIQALQKRAQA